MTGTQVKENSVNVIFAVTEEQFDVYNLLQANVEGSSAGRFFLKILFLQIEDEDQIPSPRCLDTQILRLRSKSRSKINCISHSVIKGTLSADSSNIVQLVKAQYQAITSSIEMKDNSTGSVKVRNMIARVCVLINSINTPWVCSLKR